MSLRPLTILVLAGGVLTGCGSASLRTSDGGAGQGGNAGSASAGQGGHAGSGIAGQGGAAGGQAGAAGGQGGAATAGHGGGAAGGGGGAAHADAGVDMSFPCNAGTDTTADPHNCGACGHSCLGGTCASSLCQPFALGTTSVDTFAENLQLSQGKIYAIAQSPDANPNPVYGDSLRDVWQADANTPGTPVKFAGAPTPVGDIPGCVIGGVLFWAETQKPVSIHSCTLSSCAATTMTIVPNINGYIGGGPYCDQAANQIIWVQSDANFTSLTVYRAPATGASPQPVTSFQATSTSTLSYQVAPSPLYYSGNPDRIFFTLTDYGGKTGTLYDISTVSPNTSGISLVTLPGIFDASVLVSNTTAVFSMFPSGTRGSAEETWAVPLPNGVISGSPPVFNPNGAASGVVDATTFYGFLGGSPTIPADALMKCTLPTCLDPVIITRGQANASGMTQDATSLYWATNSTLLTTGFTIWKVAK